MLNNLRSAVGALVLAALFFLGTVGLLQRACAACAPSCCCHHFSGGQQQDPDHLGCMDINGGCHASTEPPFLDCGCDDPSTPQIEDCPVCAD